ncbi:MAG: beta-N-acetylhexosaminidase, partial [Lentisphaeria bacterium]
EDSPSFSWRGMHLDVSRHFFSVNEIKKFLDQMAQYKMNVFHWHLTDGPGWRIEIKKYPKLTSVGAWRKNKTHLPWNWQDTEINPDGKQPNDYGGFYTQKQIIEIVQYAASKNIMVVPEIEMPGHSYAALLAYPQFSCNPNQIKNQGLRGKDVFCLGNPNTISFLQNILEEIIPLFPAPFFHIGADEVPFDAWKNCHLCQQKMVSLNSNNFKSLQTNLVQNMAKFLKKYNKTLIGWDEIIDQNLPKNATVMVWREGNFAQKALDLGHNIIFCPTSHCYFDYYQAPIKNEPLAIGGMVTLQKVYSFTPPKNSAGKVLGGQANIWTEFISNIHHLEYMTWPRASALAERLWNQNASDFHNFKLRLAPHLKMWKKQNYNSRPLN